MGALFEAANSSIKNAAKKAGDSAVSREQEIGIELGKQAVSAARLELACIFLTAVALTILVASVMQIAWIFLQR